MTSQRMETITVVGFLILVQATGAMAGFWMPAIAPEVGAGLGVDPALIGYQVLIVYIVAMASSLAVGGIVARFGAWRTSQAALVLFTAGHLLFYAGRFETIVIGSIVLGWGYGLVTPPAAHLLSKVVTPQNRNFVFSVRFTGVPLGGFAAGAAGPAVALAFGWRESMLVTAVSALVLAIAMQPWRRRWDDDRSPDAPLLRNPIADIVMVWRNAPLRWIALMGLCMGAVQTTLTTYTVTMLVEDIGFTLVAAGAGLSVIQVASAFGRVGWGWAADRVGSGFAMLIVLGLFMGACALATALLTPGWPVLLVYALCFAFGFSGMGWNGVFGSEIARLAPPGQIGSATGASMFITFSGVFLGPVIFANVHAVTAASTPITAVAR